MNISLAGQRALVTGASSGIGEAIARALGEAGAEVAVNYRSHPDRAAKVVEAINRSGSQAFAIRADVANAEEVAEMFRQLDQKWDRLDLLINNAGMDGPRALAWEANIDDWRHVLDVNLLGPFYCAREALQRMVPKKRGVIIATSSVHQEIAWAGYSAYASSKAALAMLTKTLAQEAAPHGVRVLAIAPGAIKTPINESVWRDPEGMRDLLKKIPLNRLGEPEEIGRMVVALASEIGSYITGRTVFIDGGMTDYPDFAHGG